MSKATQSYLVRKVYTVMDRLHGDAVDLQSGKSYGAGLEGSYSWGDCSVKVSLNEYAESLEAVRSSFIAAMLADGWTHKLPNHKEIDLSKFKGAGRDHRESVQAKLRKSWLYQVVDGQEMYLEIEPVTGAHPVLATFTVSARCYVLA
jgi:hypothetical protein